MTFTEKTLMKVTAAVLHSLEAQHPLFSKASALDVERFMLQIYSAAPAHVRLALSLLSIYIKVLALLLYFKPFQLLSFDQVEVLISLMNSSGLGALRAYSRFAYNIVTLSALSEPSDVS